MSNRRRSDDDPEVKELKEWMVNEKIKEGVRQGISKWTRTVCITAVTTLWGSCISFGAFLYSHWRPLTAAIKAFLNADNGGHG